MGSRVLVVIATLSACDTSGIRIDVIPPGGDAAMRPDKIRLFIGKHATDSMGFDLTASIAPDSFAPSDKRHGNIWPRDPMNSGDTLDVSGTERVSFSFRAESDFEKFGAIVAVGYTNDVPTSAGSLFHVHTGVGTVQIFDLQLHPAFDPRLSENRTKDLQLAIWGPTTNSESCLHLRNTRADRVIEHMHDNIFIVSEGDRDCDGYPDDDAALECDADAYKAMSPAKAEDLTCSLQVAVPGNAWCMLGGPRCLDGQPATPDECSPSRFCAPPSVCSTCANGAGLSQVECIRDPYVRGGPTLEMFSIKCNVMTERDTNSGTPTTKFCQDSDPILLTGDLGAQLMNPPKCSNATIANVSSAAHHDLQVGPMKFEVSTSSSCAFTVTPSGDLGPNFTDQTVTGMVTVDLDTGRSVAVPILIRVEPPLSGCSAVSTCMLTGLVSDRPSIQCLSGL